jgi:hypothetical protein
VPVKQVTGIGLRPVAVARDTCFSTRSEIGKSAFGGVGLGRDVGDGAVRILRVAACVTVCAPFDVDKAFDAAALCL